MEIISRKEAKELGLKRYFTGKPCKHGHVAERFVVGCCCDCASEYRKQNKEKIADWQANYRKENKGKSKPYMAKYRKQNKEKIANYMTKYRKENPMSYFTRESLNRIFDNWRGRRAEAEAIHDYTFCQLKEHIESQFQNGMTWDNRSEWHIDHIKPIKAFLDEGITDPAIINALDNLQPLWAHENLSKGAKWEMENIK